MGMENIPRAHNEAGVPVALSVPEQALDVALAKGLARRPPVQMEKETFPPGWAPTGALLQDLPVFPLRQQCCPCSSCRMGTRSDGKMEPHVCVDAGYRRERLI